MKDDKEGKEERIKYIVKKYIIMLVGYLIFSFILNIEFLPDEKEMFFGNFMQSVLFGVGLDLILVICEYVSLEKKVKELNK